MKVRDLSLRLTHLNPMIDSTKTEEDGKICRDVFIELRSGNVKILARIDETKENKYSTDFKGYKSLTKGSQDKLKEILDEYCSTPVSERLAK